MISAKIIADSKCPRGHRLTTFILTFPRIILAELNTHRMLSRNSASSRAIPFNKMLKMVDENPFIPIKWMKDHSGMQGNEYFDYGDAEVLKEVWLRAKDDAIKHATSLSNYQVCGVTKQICNRLLESFMWHTAIVTGTEWENFFALRAHDAAEIHLQDLAYKMLYAMNESTPKLLQPGEWHIPFGDKIDDNRVLDVAAIELNFAHDTQFIKETIESGKLKIATARCARVSYINFDGKDDYEADIKLANRLEELGHMSPFEHCAKVMTKNEYTTYISGICSNRLLEEDAIIAPVSAEGWSGNFRGFIQYRKTIGEENKKDNRLTKK